MNEQIITKLLELLESSRTPSPKTVELFEKSLHISQQLANQDKKQAQVLTNIFYSLLFVIFLLFILVAVSV